MTKIIARSINNTVNCTFYEKSEDIHIYIYHIKVCSNSSPYNMINNSRT